MARPPKDRQARQTLDRPLSPTETVDMVHPKGGKPFPQVTKHGGREGDRAIDPKVFEDGKLTKSAKLARLFRQAVALRLADWSVPDIAEELGLSPGVVTRMFVEFQQKVDLEAIAQRLDGTAVSLAVDNLVHGLLAGDKDYTLETLKGRGFFKRHSDGGDHGPATRELPALRVEFVSPAGAASVEIGGASEPPMGKVVGAIAVPVDITPRELSAPAPVDVAVGLGVPLAPDDPGVATAPPDGGTG